MATDSPLVTSLMNSRVLLGDAASKELYILPLEIGMERRMKGGKERGRGGRKEGGGCQGGKE